MFIDRLEVRHITVMLANGQGMIAFTPITLLSFYLYGVYWHLNHIPAAPLAALRPALCFGAYLNYQAQAK